LKLKKIVLLTFTLILFSTAVVVRLINPVVSYSTETELPMEVDLPVHNIDSGKNFSTIQGAIKDDETLDGHTILVDAGTYYEHVFINKSISLIGENRSTTIIDGNETGTIVTITTENVSISGFTIQHGGFDQSCIYISSANGVTINDNAISNNFEGIHLNSSNGNDIADNLISPYAAVGIFLEYS